MDASTLLQKKWFHFLAPKYWGLWIAFGFLRLSAFLPYSMLLYMGKGCGKLFMLATPKHKHITAVNLKLCFPELSETERKKLLNRCFESAGIGAFETALAWWASDERLKKIVILKGKENLEAANAKNKGTLIVTCHFTSIELGIRLSSLFTSTNIFYRPQNNIFSEWLLQKNRKKYVKIGIKKNDAKGFIKILKTPNEFCYYTPDQDSGRTASIFAPFFNITAATVIGANTFIKKTKCSAIPAFYYRDIENKKYILDYQPLLTNFPSGDDIADATFINQILEQGIRKAPEQYFWFHRRFKTQPDNQKKAYLYEK